MQKIRTLKEKNIEKVTNNFFTNHALEEKELKKLQSKTV